MQGEGMDDNQDASGRARLRLIDEEEDRWRYHWLLLVPLLALGYGFYTQFDRMRDMFTPDPVVEVEPLPDPAPAPTASVPAAPALHVREAPRESAEPPVDVAPAPRAAAQEPPLRALFPVPAEPPVRARTPGKAGLVEALRKGELRLATASDFNRWKSSHARNAGSDPGNSFDEHASHMDAYVIQKDFEIPGDLSGANAVVFLVEPRAPFPRGDAGHSPILDMESGACIGAICRMLMPGK